MITLNEIRKHVIENGFGTESTDDGWLLSAGIRYACEKEPDTWPEYVKKAKEQVYSGDYGDFYEYDEKPTLGQEYYLCESPYGCDINTGIVVHHERGAYVMYFQFER